MRGTVFVICTLLALLAFAAATAWYIWEELADVDIGFHGAWALGLGVGLTFIVGVGLMSLVYISSRRGYDEAAGPD